MLHLGVEVYSLRTVSAAMNSGQKCLPMMQDTFICAHASSSVSAAVKSESQILRISERERENVLFRNGTSPAGSPGYPPLADVLFDALALDEVAAPMWLELSLAVIVRPPFVIVRIGASTASLFFGASSSFLVISAAVCGLRGVNDVNARS